MSGKKHAGTCGGCAACRDCRRGKALQRAQAAVAAETGKRMARRHVLDLGDRAVEVVSSAPGVWHLVTDDQLGPVLAPDDISGMLEADRCNRAGRGLVIDGPEEAAPAAPADPAAAIMLELSGPLGLSAAEMERMVPDRAPGTCVSCRMPLAPRDKAEKCAWCEALHSFAPRPAPAAPPAVGRHAGVRPVPARRRSVLFPVLLLTWAVIFYGMAYDVYFPFIIPAAITFTAFLMSVKRRR